MEHDLMVIRPEVEAENSDAATLIDVLLIGLQGVEIRPGQLLYALDQLRDRIPHKERHKLYTVLSSFASTRWQEPSWMDDDLWLAYGEQGKAYVLYECDDAESSLEVLIQVLNFAMCRGALSDEQDAVCFNTQEDLKLLLPEMLRRIEIAA